MYLTGIGITVNNANMRNNGYGYDAGLLIGGLADITLAGDITTANNNYWGFVTTSSTKGTVYVTGNLNSYHNVNGVATYAPEFTLVVGGSYSGKSGKSGSGSLTACDNTLDINNAGTSTFEGSDYTCDTTDGPVPECKPCYPGCDEPSGQTSQAMAMAQETMNMGGNHHKTGKDEPIPAY